jgi:uncharacterized protein
MPEPIGRSSSGPSIRLDGQPAAAMSSSLVGVSVEATVEGLTRCELTLGNWGARRGARAPGYLWFDQDVLDLGHHLEVTLGTGARRGQVFSGVVTGLQARYPAATPPEIVVVAHDRFIDLLMTRRTRTFEDVTDAEVLAAVASAHGLTVDVAPPGPTHRAIIQGNTSDLAFVRHRARFLDADLWLAGTTIEVRARSAREPLPATWTSGSDLVSFEVNADLTGQRSAVHVSGYSRHTKDTVEATADQTAIAGELAGGTSGPQRVIEVFGDRVERVVHLAPDAAATAQALADERLRSTARRFVTATAVIEGDARARPGTRASFAGLGSRFDGGYGIVGVRHTHDISHGYRSTLELERAGLGGSS